MAKKIKQTLFDFLIMNIDRFTFCGKAIDIPSFSRVGVTAREAFNQIESTGKHAPTSQPLLLRRILQSKASIHWHIERWSEGAADGTFPGIERRAYFDRIQLPRFLRKAFEGMKIKRYRSQFDKKKIHTFA